MQINIIICCHNHLFSEGLKKLLEDEMDMSVTCLPSKKTVVEEELKKIHDAIIISDIDSFFDFLNDIPIEEGINILIIQNTPHASSMNGQFSELMSKGVVGMLLPETDSFHLKKALRSVHSGELWIDHKTVKAILFQKNKKSTKLTNKEVEIANYISDGLRNKEIASKLNITEQTVKSHLNRIYKKMGVTDRLQLALHYKSSA